MQFEDLPQGVTPYFGLFQLPQKGPERRTGPIRAFGCPFRAILEPHPPKKQAAAVCGAFLLVAPGKIAPKCPRFALNSMFRHSLGRLELRSWLYITELGSLVVLVQFTPCPKLQRHFVRPYTLAAVIMDASAMEVRWNYRSRCRGTGRGR